MMKYRAYNTQEIELNFLGNISPNSKIVRRICNEMNGQSEDGSLTYGFMNNGI